MVTSNRQQVKDVSYVSEEMVRLQWILDDDFVETSGRTNVEIAAYTTAQARLKLYSYLETLGDGLYMLTQIRSSLWHGQWNGCHLCVITWEI